MGVKRSPQFRMLVVVILLAFLSQTAWAQVMPAGSSGYYEGSGSKEEEGVIVPPDYQLGPGDVVRIMLKGEISGEWSVHRPKRLYEPATRRGHTRLRP